MNPMGDLLSGLRKDYNSPIPTFFTGLWRAQLTTKRKGLIQVGGKDATIIGDDIKVGRKAPDFAVFKTDWTLIKALKETKGKVRILAPLPSLDTETCDRETRRFNQEAAGL